MNKFKFGDKVHIKPLNLDGEILGWEQKIINNFDCGYKYAIEVLVDNVPHVAGDVPEKDIELVEYNDCSCDCSDCCGYDVCEDSDYKNNKEAEDLGNCKKFDLGDLVENDLPYEPDEDEREMIEEIAYERYIQYESRKLAWDKYRVPMGWKE